MSQSHCSFAIGIDIGGSTSRAALVDNLGTIVESVRRPTPERYDELLQWIAATATVWTQAVASSINTSISIGLALPGVVDPAGGTLVRSVNLPWLEGQAIVDRLEREVGCRPFVMTDAEAATWGEYVAFGSPSAPFAHLRLGTGVACGVVAGGRIIPTDPSRRTHWSVLVVDRSDSAPLCPCGLRGCLELFASGKSLERKARDLGLHDVTDLYLAYQSGQTEAKALIDHAGLVVARAITNLAAEFTTKRVILGGGVMGAIPELLPVIRQVNESSPAAIGIEMSKLGDDAGIIGAALYANPNLAHSTRTY